MEKKLMDKDKSSSDEETDTDVPDGDPEPSRRCIAQGCQNYGNEKNNFLCNSCLLYVQKKILASHSDSDRRNGTCVTPTCPNNTPDSGMCMECSSIFTSRKSALFTTQMSTEKCETPGCRNFGHVHKKNLCNDCYQKRQFGCITKNCTNFSLAKNDFLCNSCIKARGSVKCSSVHCQEPAIATLDGKCRMCYLKYLEPAVHGPGAAGDASASTAASSSLAAPPGVSGNSPSASSLPASAHIIPTVVIGVQPPGISSVRFSSINPPAAVIGDRPSEWKICATQGCSNVETKDGFCTECLLLRYNNKQAHKASPCIKQGCSNQGVLHFNDLCPGCFHSDLHVSEAQATAGTGTPKKCITPDCPFFGSIEHNGLCSKCLQKYTEIAEPPRPNSPSNRTCRGPGCEYFGNPNTEGFCSMCYKNYLYEKNTPMAQSSKRRHASGPSAVSQAGSESLRRDVLDVGSSSPSKQLSLEPTSNSTTEDMKESAEVFKSGQNSLSPDSTYGQITSTHISQVGSSPTGGNLTTGSSSTSPEAVVSPTTTPKSQKMFSVLSEQCKNEQCDKKCVQETYPYCLSCFENFNLQPKPSTIQTSMPLSRNHSESFALSVGSIERTRSVSNPELNSLSDQCERPGCLNPTSPSTYPLCLQCGGSPWPQGEKTLRDQGEATQGEKTQGKTRQDAADSRAGSSGGNKPDSQHKNQQAEKTAGSKDGNSNCASTAKTHVSLKVKTMDPSNINCDIMLCLWSKDEANKGTHPLLTKLQLTWNDQDTPQLRLGEVIQTVKGVSKARCLLHCMYEKLDQGTVANSLYKLVLKAEAMKAEYLVLPVQFLESLKENPKMVTYVCLSVINKFQKPGNRSKKHLSKFCMCFGSEEQIRQAKEEFVRVGARKAQQNQCVKGNQQACHKCQRYPQAKLKPVSVGCAAATCSPFCLSCLKEGRKGQLTCPHHGECLAPVGHKNTFALLVAGYDKTKEVAKIFIKDTMKMRDVLANQNFIGISPENMRVVTATQPGVVEDITTRLRRAFSELRVEMGKKDCNHVMFFFYYSGHHNNKVFKLGGNDYTMTPKELRRELRSLDAENILITLDCCHSAGANLTDPISEEDFIVSLGSCSKDDSEPSLYLPKLWTLYDDDDDDLDIDGHRAKGNDSKVYQWSSCVKEDKSYYNRNHSFFTLCVVKLLEGVCPCKEENCEDCDAFIQETLLADGVFLKNISTSVERHVSRLHRKQYPDLAGTDDDILVAFHALP